jgi:basic membrane lipoprotein Med (substrate-binding protein (PBP1-ABC) superfamily)
MTISPWTIYLFGIADSIRSSLQFAVFIGVVVSFIYSFFTACDGEFKGRTLSKIAIPTFLVGVCAALMPSSKTIAMMVVIPAIVNSEPIQKDLPDLYRLGVDALKEQIKPESK